MRFVHTNNTNYGVGSSSKKYLACSNKHNVWGAFNVVRLLRGVDIRMTARACSHKNDWSVHKNLSCGFSNSHLTVSYTPKKDFQL